MPKLAFQERSQISFIILSTENKRAPAKEISFKWLCKCLGFWPWDQKLELEYSSLCNCFQKGKRGAVVVILVDCKGCSVAESNKLSFYPAYFLLRYTQGQLSTLSPAFLFLLRTQHFVIGKVNIRELQILRRGQLRVRDFLSTNYCSYVNLVILAGKRNSCLHSTMSFSDNVIVAETSYQILEV